MEAAKHLLHSPSSSPPPSCPPRRTHLKNSSSSARYFPASSLIQEQRDESKPLSHLVKEDIISQGILDRRLIGPASSANTDQFMNDFQLQMLQWPGLISFPSLETKESTRVPSVEPHSAVALAKKALSASREAASLAEASKLSEDGLSDSLGLSSLAIVSVEEERTERSTRLLQRHSKKRMQKPKVMIEEIKHSKRPNAQKKISAAINQNDPLRLFLSCGETKLLTLKEERELIQKIQVLMKLEEVKNRLHDEFTREPTIIEWAEAIGLSCRALQSELHSGKSSREKLIYANFRMVVHLAKQYQGRGLSLPDLLQEGSMGLMKSVEKFKPQAGCRFATYAYWWIRQAIRKAIFQHSRTIRLPENVYGLLSKVREAKKLCVQQGHHQPKKEEIAACAGITVEKLDKLLSSSRMPLSMQQPVWTDQNCTFQAVTADNSIEVPDTIVGKQLMRKHVRSLLNVLSPKERRIIQLRFGIKDRKLNSLSEIGVVFGLSKERIRQLETRALDKLKQHLGSHGLGAYTDLLI